MIRYRLTAVLLTSLAVAFTAGPGHAASPPEGADGLQKVRQEIKELKEEQARLLRDVEALRKSMSREDRRFDTITRQLGDLKDSMEGLRTSLRTPGPAETRTSLYPPPEGSASKEAEDLRKQIDRLKEDLAALWNQAPPRVSFYPSASTGRVRLVNTYARAMDFVVNGQYYRLVPGESREVEVPAGVFTYQALGVQGESQSRYLAVNDTFTIVGYPR